MTGPQGSIVPTRPRRIPIDPGVRVGHVHLRTADIDRIRDFYVGVLGFDVVFEARDVPGWGTTGDILFLSAGGYHHHLGFNTWKSAGGGAAARRRRRPAPRRAPYPTRRGARRRRAAPAGGRLAAAPDRRPRDARGDLHHRSGRQRPRALVGPAVEEWPRDADGHAAGRSTPSSIWRRCSPRRRLGPMNRFGGDR